MTTAVTAPLPGEQSRQQYDLLEMVQLGQVTAQPQGILFVGSDGNPLSPPLQRLMVTLTGSGLIADPPGAASLGWVPGLTDAGVAAIAGAAPGPKATLRADGLYCSVHGILLPMPADGTLGLPRADRAWSNHVIMAHDPYAPAKKVSA